MAAPGREFSDALDTSPDFYAAYQRPVFEVRITYSDMKGIKYDESATIDMTFAGRLVSYGESPDVGDELKKIRELLETR